jgi:hypothetical protein
LLIPVSGLAQEVATSLDPVWPRLKRAEPLIITEASGRVLRGTILDRTSTSLVLQQSGRLLNVPMEDSQTIARRKGITAGNDAAIGALVGAAVGILIAEASGSLKHEDGCRAAIVNPLAVLPVYRHQEACNA